MDPKEIVANGYDRIANRYAEWAPGVRVEERQRYTELLLEGLPEGANVLELGCGSGLPTTRQLAKHFRVTGVDISEQQITFARQNVPEATFDHADMTALNFPPGQLRRSGSLLRDHTRAPRGTRSFDGCDPAASLPRRWEWDRWSETPKRTG